MATLLHCAPEREEGGPDVGDLEASLEMIQGCGVTVFRKRGTEGIAVEQTHEHLDGCFSNQRCFVLKSSCDHQKTLARPWKT